MISRMFSLALRRTNLSSSHKLCGGNTFGTGTLGQVSAQVREASTLAYSRGLYSSSVLASCKSVSPLTARTAQSTGSCMLQSTKICGTTWYLYNSRRLISSAVASRSAEGILAPLTRTLRSALPNQLVHVSKGPARNFAQVAAASDTAQGAGAKKTGVKEMFRRYGLVFVVTYAGIYLSTLSALFGLIHWQVMKTQNFSDDELPDNPFNPIEVQQKVFKWLEAHGIDMDAKVQYLDNKVHGILKSIGVDSGDATGGGGSISSSFALAWITAKFTEPIRALIAIVITPKIARAVGRAPKL